MPNHKATRYLSVLLFFLSFSLFAEPTIENGKTVFKNYCAQCHAKDMKTDATGPALAGTEERWADYPREELYAWIRNSQKLIASGHPRAVELWAKWGPTVMTPWPNLTDDDVESVLLYIKDVEAGKKAGDGLVDVAGGETEEKSSGMIFYLLIGLLGLLALILARIILNLNRIVAEREGSYVERKNVWDILSSKSFISFLIFGLVVFGGYTTVKNATNLGRQQNYAPDQPIKFSHATHAGLHKIDCQYCHDGARRSKHSVIPAANTCMNCHKAIKKGSEYGTAELTKIYASVGYDPSTNKYVDDYENMDESSIKEIYAKWIGDNYVADEGLDTLNKEGKRVVEEQWDGIKSSLTNDQKKTIPGPIEWIRIHNLPDHAYFNHAQHVSVGKVECQACHGKVEEMDIVHQYSPLSMGWCVNCHRETEVKFADNDYYKSYAKYHEELASGEKKKVTVEDIGGLECQKCHY